jgi:uncharacterized MFS-type transporter YbfB
MRTEARRRIRLWRGNPGIGRFSLVPALLPQFIATWSLSNAEAGWLAGMMSAGYMAAVLPLVALTDRMASPALHAESPEDGKRTRRA